MIATTIGLVIVAIFTRIRQVRLEERVRQLTERLNAVSRLLAEHDKDPR